VLKNAPLEDSCGRGIDYLRLSVTDKCDLRCAYCRPEGGSERPATPLTDDELVSLVARLAALGIRRVRVTGGEPLTRPGIADLVDRLAAIDGIADLAMTTNGLRLAEAAPELAKAGLRRVNISLDSLRPERFAGITGVDGLSRVREGIDAAFAAGLSPVKLNVVVMRGFNEDEVPDFIDLTRDRALHVRFIELMPLGAAGAACGQRWVSLEEIRRRGGPLEPLRETPPVGAGPATYLQAPGAKGTVGFIGALSEKFCADCNRLRLTAAGKLLSCLARSEPQLDLVSLVRCGAAAGRIETAVRELIQAKNQSHEMTPGGCLPETCMAAIGG